MNMLTKKQVILTVMVFTAALLLYCSAFAGTVQLPETGQRTSYRAGDDGELERGVAWPNPRFAVNGDCVTDNLTGLMWSRNANLAGYMYWNAALNYANNLTLCGYSDWRLPNRKELRSLIDYSNYGPALPTGHPFTNVQSNYYWSSTSYASDTSSAWIVSMWNGFVYNFIKDYYYVYVWPVRSGQVGGSFGNLDISPDSHDYGNVNVGASSPAMTFTASNTGTGNLEIYTITITGTDSSDFNIQNDYCTGAVLAPSGNCTIEAVFSPSSGGLKSANMSIPSNDPDMPVLDVPLLGTGIFDVAGCIDLDGSPLNNKKVILKQTGEVNQTTTTDSGGCYVFTDAVSGKAFTVQINGPVLSSPVPVINGCAELQGSAMTGRKVLLKQDNELNKSTKTDIEGCYNFSNAVPDKKFKLLIKGPVVP
ncbi:MAG: DUF1566 domain-containing protein [Nitrospiraceae bacterium]|nr:MAG: DUF1566 domain-containing protein [Nitrospiraceae bacterium]